MSLSEQTQQWYPTSVQVTVLQARSLRIKGKNGTNDAYAIMQVAKDKFSTAVAEKCVAPVWKEEATFDLPLLQPGNAERCTLQVCVMHRALMGPDKMLGQAIINLLELHDNKSRNKTEWFKLVGKTGKADKDRGEVLLDIQFMKNNMTASMFDLSGQDKSRSRFGKLKDKMKGKKKDSISDSSSAIVPSVSQILTDSEGEEDTDATPGSKKKNKLKSLFVPKSGLHRNMSQSMSTLGTLPEKDSAISLSRSSGLNVESPEGKKKFKFLKHKRTGSSDSKVSLGASSLGQGTGQSNVCINGSHVYTEEPDSKGSRAGSTFSLNSSGHGSMEDLRRKTSTSSTDFHKTSDLQAQENAAEEMRRRQEEQRKQEEEARKRLEEEKRRQAEEEERERIKREEKRKEEERKRVEEERKRIEKEEEKRRLEKQEEERKRIEREEEKRRLEKQEEERKRIKREEEKRRLEKQEEERKRIEREEEKRRLEKQEEERRRIKMEEEKRRLEKQEEERKRIQTEMEEKRRIEEEERERKRIEEEEMVRRKREQERVRQEEERKKAEEERIRVEARKREEEEKIREERRIKELERKRMEEDEQAKREEEKQRKMEEEERVRLEKERLRKEEETRRIEMERKHAEEEERLRKEKEKMEAEKKRKEEEERRMIEEKERKEQETLRLEKEKLELEKKKMEEKEKMRKEQERQRAEEEEQRRIKEEAEQERIRQEEEEMEKPVKKKERSNTLERRPAVRARSARMNTVKKTEKPEDSGSEFLASSNPFEEELLFEENSTNFFEQPTVPQPEAVSRSSKVSAVKPSSSVSGIFFSQATVPNTNPFVDESDAISSNTENTVGQGEGVEFLEKKRRAPLPPQNKKQMVKSEVPTRTLPSPSVLGATQSFPSRESEDSGDSDVSSLRQDKRPVPLPPDVYKEHADLSTTPPFAGEWRTHGTQKSDEFSISQNEQHFSHSQPQAETNPFISVGVKKAKHNKGPAPAKPSSKCTSRQNSASEPESSSLSSVDLIEHLTEHSNEATENIKNVSFEGDEMSGSSKKKTRAPLPPSKTAVIGDQNSTSQQPENVSISIIQPTRYDQGTTLNVKRKVLTPSLNLSLTNSSLTSSLKTENATLRVEAGLGSGHKSLPHARVPPIDAQAGPEQSNGGETKRTGAFTVCRPHAVKPLSATERQLDLIEMQDNSRSAKITDDMQTKVKAPEVKATGPYSQLTREELIGLVEKQKEQLSQKDSKILELEQYIDNLLVRVMEEKPSILMALNSMKKAV